MTMAFDEIEYSLYIGFMKPVVGLFFISVATFPLFLSCSFNYGNEAFSNKMIPEMVLTGVEASRYKDARLSMVLSADMLEMYDTDQIWAGEKVSFLQYASDGSGTLEAEGQAGILLVDDASDVYSLGENTTFHSIKDNLVFSAEDLRWTKQTHRLSSPVNGKVEIEKSDGSKISGTGFFADTLARVYEFSNPVTGKLVNGNSTQ